MSKIKNFIQNNIRIDRNKNTKFTYYFANAVKFFLPLSYYKAQLATLLNEKNIDEEILRRVQYYNKIANNFKLKSDAVSIEEFIKNEKKKTYYFDLLEYLRYFDKKLKISYLFGDITTVPDTPSFLKSRPIEGNNENSILMKLNKIRHFIFIDDKRSFEEKKDLLVWRGKCYTNYRQKFIQEFYNKPFCNVGQTNSKDNINVPWQKEKLSLEEQLKYKFILAIEGNDVASNLKWAMSSNSLVFMTKPKYETWFMEGTLIANYHYVLLNDDYSDLEEKVKYYAEHIRESRQIIENAHNHVEQFKNKQKEEIISLLVLKQYFEQSGQLKKTSK